MQILCHIKCCWYKYLWLHVFDNLCNFHLSLKYQSHSWVGSYVGLDNFANFVLEATFFRLKHDYTLWVDVVNQIGINMYSEGSLESTSACCSCTSVSHLRKALNNPLVISWPIKEKKLKEPIYLSDIAALINTSRHPIFIDVSFPAKNQLSGLVGS